MRTVIAGGGAINPEGVPKGGHDRAGCPCANRLCPVFLGPGPWGEWLEVDSKVRRSHQSSPPVDKPLDAGFDGRPPLEGAGGDLRRTKALTIAERSTMTGYPD